KNRSGESAQFLHFGWKLGKDQLSTKEGWKYREEPALLWNTIATVAKEAFECRRLPAFYGNDAQKEFLRSCWPGGTITLKDLATHPRGILGRLEEMTDYPWNGIMKKQFKK